MSIGNTGKIIPSYHQGLATHGESKAPELWDGNIASWAPFLGPTGNVLRDDSGRGNNGAISGAVWETGILGRELRFNANKYVQIPKFVTVGNSFSEITVLVSFRSSAASSNVRLINHYDSFGDNRAWNILRAGAPSTTNGKWEVFISGDGRSTAPHFIRYESSVSVFDDLYHIIGFRFVAGELDLFNDEIKDLNPTKKLDPGFTTINDCPSDVFIGAEPLNNVASIGFFDGRIVNALIFNRGLPDGLIAEISSDLHERYRRALDFFVVGEIPFIPYPGLSGMGGGVSERMQGGLSS